MFTRLLSLWVTGALLLPLSCGSEDEDVTPTSNYDYDYENATLDYYTYNPESYEVLNVAKNKDSVQVFRCDLILSGLLVILVCQQT
ncbi:hypothetical protein IRJ41_005108 [Triplophysa rosa]|uniref:Uncharacterized protein n=1 Tax=Triplophysa rosa TaxID=992332 RepID=A0A9W7WQB2_TRIRA|nr:hypothetical protein IRJ41_005108 [Triplophysa rosa]